jgi:preprotein translocase subunit SecY
MNIDTIEKYLIYPFQTPNRIIQTREKHFNTLVFTIIALLASEIPLVGGIVAENYSEVTFTVTGTLMHYGTQPFVFASMVTPFLVDDAKASHSNMLGFFISVFLGVKWSLTAGNWIGGLQLCMVAWGLLQSEAYLEKRGSIQPSTALVFAHASQKILLSVFLQPVSFAWMLALIYTVAWIENLSISIPLTHIKYRHQSTGMNMSVMHNSTTALVVYYTLIETISTWYSPAKKLIANGIDNSLFLSIPCLYLSVYVINGQLATINAKNGKDLVQQWKKDKYTIKGWRDPQKMYKYVQNIIDRNVHWNTVFICLLWTLGFIYRPPVGITTLFILISTVKRHRPTWKLF